MMPVSDIQGQAVGRDDNDNNIDICLAVILYRTTNVFGIVVEGV